MADIDALIARPVDASAFLRDAPAQVLESYWKGLEQAYNQRNRDAFKNGVPSNPDGSPNYTEIANTTLKAGGVPGIPGYKSVADLDLARQQLVLGQQASRAMGGMETGGQAPLNVPTIGTGQRPPPQGGVQQLPPPPPSNVAGTGPIAPRVAPGQGDNGQNTIASIVTQHYPPEVAGPIINNFADRLKLDPNSPITDPAAVQRLSAVVQRMAQVRNGAGAPPQAAPPQAQPQAPAAPPATFGQRFDAAYPPQTPNRVQAPTGVDPEIQNQIAKYTQIVSNPALPESVRKAAQTRLEDIQKRNQPTDQIKNYEMYRRQGGTQDFETWRDKEARDKEDLQVLEKAVIPRVNASLEKATAARDDILAIHRAREQLDTSPGVVTGMLAGNRLDLERFGALLGLPSDRVANTESFRAAIGSRVTSLVKALGSGTAISNSDRVFAEKMAGGQIELNEASIRRILEIGERANREMLGRHDKLVSEVGNRNRAFKEQGGTFKVEIPPSYSPPNKQPQSSTATQNPTATNPQTGERLMLQNGKWVPFT